MIFRGSKTSDDWTFGRGKQCYLRDNDAISKDIATTLRSFATECFFNTDFGLPWFNLLGQKKIEPLLLSVQAAILECSGVVRITNLEASRNEDRSVLIYYTVDTIYSSNLSGSVVV